MCCAHVCGVINSSTEEVRLLQAHFTPEAAFHPKRAALGKKSSPGKSIYSVWIVIFAAMTFVRTLFALLDKPFCHWNAGWVEFPHNGGHNLEPGQL